MSEAGFDIDFVQDNHSYAARKGVSAASTSELRRRRRTVVVALIGGFIDY